MTSAPDIRVLTWNLFHGQDGARLGPSIGSTFLGRDIDDGTHVHRNKKWLPEMAAVISARAPTIVTLQEVPPLGVAIVADATGMQAVRSVMPPLIGTTRFRGRLAQRNPDLWQTHEGTANAILIAPEWEVVPGGSWTVRHNPPRFVTRLARRLSLGRREAVHWLLEPRRLVAARVRHRDSGLTVTVVSMHCHNSLIWDLIAHEVRRVVPKVLDRVPPEEPVLVAGDLNAAGRSHPAITALQDLGLDEATIDELVLDHIFHRNLQVVTPPHTLPTEVRELEIERKGAPRKVVLSDHDLVEAVYRIGTPATT
jgi:endonuclease/exonuclease/phosphatase family metal-dependent hydrolase